MRLTLVVLAAGKGSRFGGNKQYAEVGPTGQYLFEYSVYDAIKCGCEHVVFVLDDLQKSSEIASRVANKNPELKVDFIEQRLWHPSETVPTNNTRTKPWGTAHAVLVCRERLNNPFVVINADDYYGADSFRLVTDFLLEHSALDKQLAVIPGYQLANTLSQAGGVNRGICKVDQHGFLQSVVEVKNLRCHHAPNVLFDEHPHISTVTLNDTVSMNMWGLQPGIFELLEQAFVKFQENNHNSLSAEFYLPEFIHNVISDNHLKVRVLPTAEIWKGLTYSEDLFEVRDFLLASRRL